MVDFADTAAGELFINSQNLLFVSPQNVVSVFIIQNSEVSSMELTDKGTVNFRLFGERNTMGPGYI